MRLLMRITAMLLLAGPAAAGELPTELKTMLQSAMISHVDQVMVDGAYSYVDPKTGSFATVYPANVHPFVVEAGNDYFVCSEMIDEAGNTVTADFLVREIDGTYRVVQMIVNDRDSVKSAIEQLN